ncbi:MAG: hypothetical protein ACFFF9_12195 [Candidatus Thorarchaeota archaeon]
MAIGHVRTTQMQLGHATSLRHVTAYSPPGITVEAAKYPMMNAGILASTDAQEYLSIYDHPESWCGLNRETILSMRRELYRFTVPINARVMEASEFVEVLQTIALSVSPVAIEVETASLPPRGLSPLGGQLPASPSVDIQSVEIVSEPEISKVAENITQLDIPSSESAWKLLDYDYSLDQVARLMSVGLLGRIDSRRLVPTRGAYKAVIDGYINRSLIELNEKPVPPSFRIYSNELLDESFTVLVQPGEPRVDYFRIERTPKGLERGASYERVKNATTDPKTAIYGDHARFSSYQHLVKKQERSHITVFHFARNNKNNVLGPWIVRAGIDAALDSNSIELDTRENAIMVLESILTPSLPIWIESDPLLDNFSGYYTTVEQSSPLTRIG